MVSACYYSGLWLLVAEAWLESVSFNPETESFHKDLKGISVHSADLGKYWAEHLMNVPQAERIDRSVFTGIFIPKLQRFRALNRIHEFLALFLEYPVMGDVADTSDDLELWSRAVIPSMIRVVLGDKAKDLFMAIVENISPVMLNPRNRAAGLKVFEEQLLTALSDHPVMTLQSRFNISQYLIGFFHLAIQLWILEEDNPIKAARDRLRKML
jgi:hypothetical protein